MRIADRTIPARISIPAHRPAGRRPGRAPDTCCPDDRARRASASRAVGSSRRGRPLLGNGFWLRPSFWRGWPGRRPVKPHRFFGKEFGRRSWPGRRPAAARLRRFFRRRAGRQGVDSVGSGRPGIHVGGRGLRAGLIYRADRRRHRRWRTACIHRWQRASPLLLRGPWPTRP